jgi:hypothetical protein
MTLHLEMIFDILIKERLTFRKLVKYRCRQAINSGIALRKRSQASGASDISGAGGWTKRANPLTCPAWENAGGDQDAFSVSIKDVVVRET